MSLTIVPDVATVCMAINVFKRKGHDYWWKKARSDDGWWYAVKSNPAPIPNLSEIGISTLTISGFRLGLLMAILVGVDVDIDTISCCLMLPIERITRSSHCKKVATRCEVCGRVAWPWHLVQPIFPSELLDDNPTWIFNECSCGEDECNPTAVCPGCVEKWFVRFMGTKNKLL